MGGGGAGPPAPALATPLWKKSLRKKYAKSDKTQPDLGFTFCKQHLYHIH
jgi:hypothetical protein